MSKTQAAYPRLGVTSPKVNYSESLLLESHSLFDLTITVFEGTKIPGNLSPILLQQFEKYFHSYQFKQITFLCGTLYLISDKRKHITS
jgi:hypothetical protein